MRPRIRLWLTLLAAVLVVCGTAHGQRLRGQAVTYTDFSFVTAVASSTSRVYFATTGGIVVYDQMADRWLDPLTGADGLVDETATDLWVDRFDQKLYAATEFGLYEFDSFFERWYPIGELPSIDNDSRKVTAPDLLLPQFAANYLGDGRFLDDYGRSFATSRITRDNSGHLWIGTWGFGPAVADDASGLMKLLPYGLLQKRVRTILPDDTVLWVGGDLFDDFRTGLTAFNPVENRFFQLESGLPQGLPVADVNCLAADADRLYVGTTLGLYFVDRGPWIATRSINRRRGLADDNVTALALHGDSLLVGTAAGLSLISLATDSIYQVYPETFRNQVIYDLEPVDSTIWVASDAGAYRYVPGEDRLFRYEDPDLLLVGGAFDLEAVGRDLWLASDAGAVRLDLTTGKSYSLHESATGTAGRALAANDRIVALASDRGVTIVFLNDGKPFSREFSVADGLASDNVYALWLDGDYLWIGTDRGLTRFLWNNPDRVD